MKLKSLEVKGFKSFGDKISINFDDGITAVVGPNGCGKSNVVDSIRWVLGEQSTKTLRSEKMENIIFNGTKNRKPANLAEVSLTFDNTKNILPTDYTTVTITRKLYRSGESEYRLNDVQCRLKDITDLFLDTGIGSDSYSIIELKMIEEILSNKDNSRRALFEEAAGISKYKIRKKQTLNKLKDTEDDLNRVEDLLFEIEKNLKSLESQAKKTERYYKLKEQYKELSTILASFRISGLKKSMEELDEKEVAHNDDKNRYHAEIDTVEAKIQEEKLESLNKEKNLGVQQKALNDYIAKIRSYENEKKIKNERLTFFQEKERKLAGDLSIDKTSVDQIHGQLETLEASQSSERKIFSEIEYELEQLKIEVDLLREDHQHSRSKLEAAQQQLQSNQNIIYKNEKELEIVKIQKEGLEQEFARTNTETNLRKEEIVEFDKEIEKLEGLSKEKTELYNQLTHSEEALKASIEKAETEIQEMKDRFAKESRKLDAKQNEFNLTKSLVESLEGFPESIKFLKKNTDWSKNAPLLSDILFCQEDYRIAIENYLESYLNYYVVDTYQEAMAGIQLLGQSAKGKANFFVLESLKDTNPQSNDGLADGLIQAMDVINVDYKYQKLAKHLLGNVLVINQNEELWINKDSDSQKVYLAKSGKFNRTKVSLSGGSVGLFEGKRIGRVKNLEVLEQEIKDINHFIEEYNRDIDQMVFRLQDLKQSTKTNEISVMKDDINKVNTELISYKTRQEQYHNFINDSSVRKEDIQRKIEDYNHQLESMVPELELAVASKDELHTHVQDSQQLFNELSDKLAERSGSFNQRNIQFHQQQNKVDQLDKEIEYKNNNLKMLQERIAINQGEYDAAMQGINEIMTTHDNTDTELIGMYEEKDAMEKATQEVEADYHLSKNIIAELEENLREVRVRKESAEQNFASIRDRKTELRMELTSLKERLSVEFSVDIETLQDVVIPEDENEDQLRIKTERLRNQIDNYGPINPLAMEAYDEMNKRYTFIQEQKNDLLSAKASLLDTIKEIDDTAKEKFMDAFTQIRDNFIIVFRSLFNEEDSCDLILTNPEDPLESDIDIIAKPKGKRPLTINQLSGGEKTLTATAILFSLYLLKPAPFCIFDEVDAPLDDTNIDKFNKIIRKFSDESQFIIVTHNKRTIASTDVVYGVTMVEQGVSRVVPVDLRQLEPIA
ncbi:MAG: chromosome segregation protein SMC [Sphingobacteriales bacterium]|nr:chromosome segregation protein SMC [Sphingobacteriales bacterium]